MKLFLPSMGWHVKFKKDLQDYEGTLLRDIEAANTNILEEPQDEAVLYGTADFNKFAQRGELVWVKPVFYWTDYDPVPFPEGTRGKVISVCMGNALVFNDRDQCLADLGGVYEPVAWLLEIVESGPDPARTVARSVLEGDLEALPILADALEEADHLRAKDIRELTKDESKPKKGAKKPKPVVAAKKPAAKAAKVVQEVVLIGGYPASGKSTFTQSFVERGYARLNRDEMGGSMAKLLGPLEDLLDAGRAVVLDNLYATKESRAEFVKLARRRDIPIRFLLMGTTLEDAQFNASLRMMEKCGRLLQPDEFKKAEFKKDPGLFPVFVIYKYKKDAEKPTTAEGFAAVETIPFERNYPGDWTNKAIICDIDGTLRTTTGAEKYPTKPSEVKAFKERGAKLRKLQKEGYLLVGASNQSGIAKGKVTKENVEACFAETEKQLGVKFATILYCPHSVPPIACYCRKPNPGLGVRLMWTYKLDPRKCICVGDLGTDRSFAERCGFTFVDQAEFFE
jgi:HAD superfamily hydrolase (TIGR01662 family)